MTEAESTYSTPRSTLVLAVPHDPADLYDTPRNSGLLLAPDQLLG
jgi:hypothetical protein